MVANHFLDDVEMGQDRRLQAVQMCKLFHQDVRSLSERYGFLMFFSLSFESRYL